MKTKILIILIVVVVIAAGGVGSYFYKTSDEKTEISPEEIAPSSEVLPTK